MSETGGSADAPAEEMRSVTMTVNGQELTRTVPVRMHLADFLRREANLTGTHLGCEHGVCGACTILLDGLTARACLMLAVQADGCGLQTVEGLAPGDELHPLQQAFWDGHGLQCGYCTPGILMTLVELLREQPRPTEAAVREALSGHLCRCTGYQNIVQAALAAAGVLAGSI
jgi:carbon-monoxide dehydrogenase small subunit